MANTFNDYTATSAQLDSSDAAYGFVFNFPFLDASHIVVEVDGSVLASSNYSIQTSPDKRVLVTSGITAGQVVRVRRDSNANSDAPLVDFVNGSVLNETELDKSYLHNLYLNEEIAAMNDLSLQKKVGDTTKWDAKSQELVNVTDPTLVQSASTKNYVDTQISNTITGSSTVSSKYTFTGDNATTAFTFSPAINLDGDTMYEVAIDGVLQAPTTAYAIDANANTITFTSAPPTSAAIVVVQRGYAVPVTINSQGLRVVDSSGISGTASFVQDGDGTNSALAISTTKVGIGTTSPSGSLDITSSISPTIFLNESTNTYQARIGVPSSAGNVFSNSAILGSLAIRNDVAIQLGGTTPSVTIKDGKVGIGTATPSDKIEIISNSPDFGATITNTTANPARLTLVNTEGSANIDCNNNLLILTNNTASDLVINSDGNVGIGTATPFAKMHVKDSQGASDSTQSNFRLEVPSKDDLIRLSFYADNVRSNIVQGKDSAVAVDTASYLAFETRSSHPSGNGAIEERMRIKSDGTINFSNVSTYANDTAAGTGGLVAGDMYKTSTGELRIKL